LNNNRNNNRRRGRGGNRQQGGGQQLNRIDSRARGNAPQLLEKYRKLAHDAHLNGDRVQEEYYLQFADHYFRVIADRRARQEEQRGPRRDDRWQEGNDGYRDDDGSAGDDGGEGDSSGYERSSYQTRSRDERPERADRQDRQDRQERPERQERGSDGNDQDEAKSDADSDEGADGRSIYEPVANPFVRESRPRGLKPRRDRSRRDEDGGDTGEPGNVGFDPSSLPPSISSGRGEETAESSAEGEAAEKPRRRTRRPRPPADDAGEALEAVN